MNITTDNSSANMVRPQSVLSDTVSVGFDTHSDSEGGSSFVSEEEEEVEVPVVAGLPPVRPSVAAQRSGYAQIDRWNVPRRCSHVVLQ